VVIGGEKLETERKREKRGVRWGRVNHFQKKGGGVGEGLCEANMTIGPRKLGEEEGKGGRGDVEEKENLNLKIKVAPGLTVIGIQERGNVPLSSKRT